MPSYFFVCIAKIYQLSTLNSQLFIIFALDEQQIFEGEQIITNK